MKQHFQEEKYSSWQRSLIGSQRLFFGISRTLLKGRLFQKEVNDREKQKVIPKVQNDGFKINGIYSALQEILSLIVCNLSTFKSLDRISFVIMAEQNKEKERCSGSYRSYSLEFI